MMTNSRSFKIVHLSDLHLTSSDDASRSDGHIFGSLQGMNDAFRELVQSDPVQQADLVLVTGDVTDEGEEEAWDVFWEAVEDTDISRRILVLPGNHDVCSLSFIPRAGKTIFDTLRDLFGVETERPETTDMRRVKDGLKKGKQPVQYPWVRRPHPKVVIFGLNSNNSGNSCILDNALGCLNDYQLKQFSRLLSKYRRVPVKIVALHHSPDIPDLEDDSPWYEMAKHWLKVMLHSIVDDKGAALMSRCLSHGVKLIVHGHLHLGEDRTVDGIRIIGAPASTEPIEDYENVYNIYSYTIRANDGRLWARLKEVII